MGPTCQSQTPLNQMHRSLARTLNIAHGDITVTVCHRSPPRHVGWSLHVCAWPSSGDPSPISLLPRARSALLRSPMPPTARLTVERHHHPPLPPLSRPEGPSSTPLHVATGCTLIHQLSTSEATVPRRRLPHRAHH
jgi:hypothetical protein